MRLFPTSAVPILFGPPGKPAALILRTVAFTAGLGLLATLVFSLGVTDDTALALVGSSVLLLLAWTKIAYRRALGWERRLARGEARDGRTDSSVLELTSKFQSVLLDYEKHVEESDRQRDELNGTVRQQTAKLVQANRKLERIDKMKDEFVSCLAHELRTPLTSIRSYVELLLRYNHDGVNESERREFLEIVRQQTQRLTRLIKEILDLSRLRSGRFDFEISDNDLSPAVAEAVTDLADLARHRSQTITIDASDDPALAKCDLSRTQQIVANLIGNAIRHGPQSRPIAVSIGHDDTSVLVSVTDRGKGIPEEERESIFEPFRKTRREGQSNEEGTGLSLYLSRELARKMSGDVWVETHAEGGSLFVMRLPRADIVSTPIPVEATPSKVDA